MSQCTEKIQEIKDGKPNLTQNLLMVNSVLEEMIANNDRGNMSMLAAARRLTLEAHSQMDALISINLAGNAGLKTAPFDHVAAYAPTWDATVEAHQNEINRLKATIQRGVKLLTKLLHG